MNSLLRFSASQPKPPVHAPEPSPPAPPPAAASPWWRWPVLCAVAMLALLGGVMMEGPPWRLDLREIATYGYPRLLGLWSPAAVLALLLVALPAWLLLGLFTAPRRSMGRWGRGLLAWGAAALMLVVVDAAFATRLDLLPESALRMLPFRGAAVGRFGSAFLVPHPQLLVTHRPGAVRHSRVDWSRNGDLAWSRLTTFPPPEAPPNLIRATRRINAQGFAAEFGEITPESPHAEVVFLGDSFTFGYDLPAEATWPALVLEQLEAAGFFSHSSSSLPPMRRALHLAAGDYTPADSLLALELLAPKARPRLVVALYFEGNDLINTVINTTLRKLGHTYTTAYEMALDTPVVGWLERRPLHALLALAFIPTDGRLPASDRRDPASRSRTSTDLDMLLPPEVMQHHMVDRMLGGGGSTALDRRALTVGGQPHLQGIHPTDFAVMGASDDWLEHTPAWHDLEDGLDRLAAYGKRTGARVVVLLAPCKLRMLLPFFDAGELDAPEVLRFPVHAVGRHRVEAAIAAGGWQRILEAGAARFPRALADSCRARGLEFHDLAPGLQAEAVRLRDPLYFPYDLHWNLAGHAAASRVVSQILAHEPPAMDPAGEEPTAPE